LDFLIIHAAPDVLHIRTLPVLPGDIPNLPICTSYTSRLSKVIERQTDRQTRRKLYATLLRGWSKHVDLGVKLRIMYDTTLWSTYTSRGLYLTNGV